MTRQDVRWKQRFSNFCKALTTLDEAVALAQTRPLTKLEQQGVIQSFEFTHELAWNVFKDYLSDKGITGLIGSKDATRSAFKNELISDGDGSMQIINDRNLSLHSYEEATALQIATNILKSYHPTFIAMRQRFESIARQDGS